MKSKSRCQERWEALNAESLPGSADCEGGAVKALLALQHRPKVAVLLPLLPGHFYDTDLESYHSSDKARLNACLDLMTSFFILLTDLADERQLVCPKIHGYMHAFWYSALYKKSGLLAPADCELRAHVTFHLLNIWLLQAGSASGNPWRI